MRPGKWIVMAVALLGLGVGLSACGGDVPGDSVASVAGNPVTMRAFDHWMFVAAQGNAAESPGAPVIVPTDPPQFPKCIAQVRKQIPTLASSSTATIRQDCGELFSTLSSQVMDFLIRGYWYQAEAAKRHITVSNKEVQQALQAAKAQEFPTAAEFNQFLAQSGQTVADILYRVRINQILKKLVADEQKSITPATIQAYYRAHPAQFGSPETRAFRFVRTNSASQAAAAKAALERGESWQTVAKQYSVDPTTKDHGGLLIGVTKGQEEQALDTLVFSNSPGKIVGPAHGTFGWYVVEVVRIKPGTQQSLAQATPTIRTLLQSQQQQNAQTTLDNQVKKAWLSQTHCRTYYAMSDCSGYNASKAKTPGAVTGSSTATASSAKTT